MGGGKICDWSNLRTVEIVISGSPRSSCLKRFDLVSLVTLCTYIFAFFCNLANNHGCSHHVHIYIRHMYPRAKMEHSLTIHSNSVFSTMQQVTLSATMMYNSWIKSEDRRNDCFAYGQSSQCPLRQSIAASYFPGTDERDED